MTLWAEAKLGDLCEVIAGQSPEGKFYNDNGEGLPFYQGKKDFGDKYIDAPRTWTKKVTKQAKDGDILMSVRAPVGPINFSVEDICIGRGLAAIRSSAALDKDFLFYVLLSKQDEIKGHEGAVFASINKKQIEQLSIPNVTLAEQQRIVAILDQAFADIEKARANAEKNLKNARELFDSYLNQVFVKCNSSVELGEVVELLTDYHANGSYEVLKQHVELKEEEDFAWMVRSTDFEKKFKNVKRYISEHAYYYLRKSKLFGGEIIMSKIGNAGKVYFMPDADRPCSLAMNLFLIRLDASRANNEYVYRYLNSTSGKAQIAPKLKGAATQTITKDNVRSLLIPLPSLDKQQLNVGALRKLEREIEALEKLYQNKIHEIENLKKSLLQKAFSGELTKDKGIAA
jgi:type I restriction enzyme S subunit